MKPDEFSLLAMYGSKDIFKKRLEEGYTEVAFGVGDWVRDYRIVGLWAFYHQDGRIATYEHPKYIEFSGGNTLHGEPFEKIYTKEEFEKHEKDLRISVCQKTGLAQIVQKWED
ncbi:hypothetical protein HYX19_00215 [Candidatus Woesearchaeota archaeon]|nr:hypothetical protein [Candidatus Woesearchaeota archaeon]